MRERKRAIISGTCSVGDPTSVSEDGIPDFLIEIFPQSVFGVEDEARSPVDEVPAQVIHVGSSESRGDATAAGVLATGEGWLGWSVGE